MAIPAPPIDQRTEKKIVEQVQSLLTTYTPSWKEFDRSTGQPQGVSAALIGVFARFVSLIIQRLNRAPEKNFLAFLDLLGASLLPPEPARVPVTFSLTAGSAVDALVPPGTQVAAPPAEGEKEPVIFETERELVVTAAQIVSLLARNPAQDQYADQSAILGAPPVFGIPAFSGNSPLDHILYIGHDNLFSYPVLAQLQLSFNLAQNLPLSSDPRTVHWEIWDGKQGIPIIPTNDGRANLTQSGVVVFQNLSQIPEQRVQGLTSRWLRARLMTPITPGAAQPGKVRASQLPTIKTISLQGDINRSDLPIEAAFTNVLPVDLTKDFFPFGEKPTFGDTLYLANAEAFSQVGVTMTLNVNLSDPDKVHTLNPATYASPDLELTWEIWNGMAWTSVGTSSKSGTGSAIGGTNFQDDSQAFTQHPPPSSSQPRHISFTLPLLKPTTVNGVQNFWIRVRITNGHYGVEAMYVPDTSTPPHYIYRPATFAPPSITKISVDYSLTKTALTPDNILTYNDFKYDAPVAQYAPFRVTQDPSPSLYLGLTLPPDRTTFPNLTLSLYFRLADVLYGQLADNPSPASPPRLAWEYWNGSNWIKLVVSDETDALRHSGLTELLPPADFAPSIEFGLMRYWLRLRWDSGDYKFLPKLRGVLLNTTTAAQMVTIRNEILGSSNGSENQAFRTTRAPLLKNQQLQVREPDIPSADEQATIKAEEGEDAISITRDATGRAQEIWVRWHPVPDFYASGPRDRHYVLDNLTGEIRFGDGISGRIPPVGTGNIRMARYQTGGGVRGNRAAGTIVQLKTTVPYVDKANNSDAAGGGAEAETLDSLIVRAPRTIRHRDRAVTLEDYEDLAMLASPEVARAKCVPLYDLAADPDAKQGQPGTVSVIIIPRSTSPKPLVSLELINRVQSYLDAHRIPTANLVVVGPDYVRVDVRAEIALTSLKVAREVEMAVDSALRSFLHPLTGGLDGAGWDFGRQPHKSDVDVLLQSVPGVDHVRTLNLTLVSDRPGADQTDRFLVYAGALTITLIFEEE